MNDRNFSRRRKTMRFRPAGGFTPPNKPTRAANEARADALGEMISGPEAVFDARHTREIDQAENVAAGLPADAEPTPPQTRNRPSEPPPAPLPPEPEFKPIAVQSAAPLGIVESLRAA